MYYILMQKAHGNALFAPTFPKTPKTAMHKQKNPPKWAEFIHEQCLFV